MITRFEDLFLYIGRFGAYQWMLFGVLCYANMLFCLCYYGQLFLTLPPPHWCRADFSLEELNLIGFNITLDELTRLTVPTTADGQGYQSCSKYNISVIEVLNQGTTTPNSTWNTMACDNGWVYDFRGNYYPSFTSEMNLVCNDDWKRPLAQAIFFIGSIFGGPLFGWIADNYGRLPVAIGSNVLSGVAGLWTAFCTTYVSFCISRFFVGFATDTNLMVLFILGLELVDEKYRTYVANIPIILFLTGSLLLLPWVAIAIGNWRILAIVISVPHLLLLILPLFFPESIRWLIDKGKYEKATKIVKRIAKINGKKLTDEFYTKFKAFFAKSQGNKQKIINWWDLLKTPLLRRRFLLLCFMWITLIVSYDADVRNVQTLGGNFFISFTLIGVMEAPADLLNIYLIERIGRRYTVFLSLMLSGISSFGVALMPRDNWYGLLVFALLCRFFITLGANCGLQYVIELLPTVARAQGSGVAHTLGSGMTFFTPYIVYMAKFYVWAPYTIVGIICLAGAISSVFLPETKGVDLPGSLEEGENAFKHQKLFESPFKSKSKDIKEKPKPAEVKDTV